MYHVTTTTSSHGSTYQDEGRQLNRPNTGTVDPDTLRRSDSLLSNKATKEKKLVIPTRPAVQCLC